MWAWAFAVAAGVGLIELVIFVVRYATSPWRSTGAGRALMAVMVVLAVLFGLIFASRLLGGLGPVVWTVALAGLDVILFQWLRLLHRERQNGRSGDVR